MVIYSSIAAMSVLNEANRQNNKLSTTMQKLATGLKVRGAGDDASAYSISEKMRVQIRSLSQCSANVNKGADITGVAEGAMREQMELLTTVRELALKSANGIYSDTDRAIMQHEVNQRLTEVDDIAVSTSYNGKLLLNQTEHAHTDEKIIPGSTSFDTEAAETPNRVALVPEPHTKPAVKDSVLCYMPPEYYHDLHDGQTVYDPKKFTYRPMTSSALPVGSTVYDANGTSYRVVNGNTTGSGAAIPAIEYPTGSMPPSYIPLNVAAGTPTVPSAGASGFMPHSKHCDVLGTVGAGGTVAAGTSIVLDDTYSSASEKYTYHTLPDGKPAAFTPNKSVDANKQNYTLDFSRLSNLPNALDKQGFSVLCDGCEQFISVIFDASRSAGTGEYCKGTDRLSGCYIIGLQGVSDASGVVKAMADGLNNAVGSAPGTNPAELTRYHYVKLNTYTAANGETQCYLEKTGQALYMYNGIKGKLTIIPDEHIYTHYMKPGGKMSIQGETAASGNTILKLPNTTLNMLFPSVDDRWVGIEPTEADYPEPWPNEYNGLTDEEKKQKFRREVWHYPEITDVDLKTCISTQQKARDFLTNIDQALRYLENSITTMGAQHQRMSVMDDNIIVSHENTSAAESTIRDADMAKEMTAYATYSILSQSSRSMLAQANQSSVNVLSLLQ